MREQLTYRAYMFHRADGGMVVGTSDSEVCAKVWGGQLYNLNPNGKPDFRYLFNANAAGASRPRIIVTIV
jgi:hypothetical protein